MKRYIHASEYNSDYHQDYLKAVESDVEQELSDHVHDLWWEDLENSINLIVVFTTGDKVEFKFEDWRLSNRKEYIYSDVNMICNSVYNYMKENDIEIDDEIVSDWEIVSRKTVKDFDGFTTDYTLWYNPYADEDKYVCIFGDNELYTPDNSEPDFSCETEWEAREWFDYYKGPGDEEDIVDDEDVESSITASDDSDDLTATDIVNWMYREFNDYEFYDERDLSDGRVRLIYETGKKSLKDDVISALEEKHIKYHFSPSGARLLIDAPDDYDLEYVGEATNTVNCDWNIEDQIDAPDTIGKLNPGDKFKNRAGIIITILEPTKDGTVQYQVGDEVKSGSEKSIQIMLYRNNYMRLEDWKVQASTEFFDKGDGAEYWYFTTHGVMPGSVPRGLNIIEIRDTPNGTFFSTDKVLTTDSLKYYDIKERVPKDVKSYFDPL